MKTKLTSFAHAANGLSLTIVPETPIEESLSSRRDVEAWNPIYRVRTLF